MDDEFVVLSYVIYGCECGAKLGLILENPTLFAGGTTFEIVKKQLWDMVEEKYGEESAKAMQRNNFNMN